MEAKVVEGSSRREAIVTSSLSDESGEADLHPPTPSKSRVREVAVFK